MSFFINEQGTTTYADIAAVNFPPAVGRWKPIPYVDMVDVVVETAAHLGMGAPSQEQYGLNKGEDQFFAALHFRQEDDSNLAIGLRGSKNKSLAGWYVDGASVFVCSNLQFSGDNVVYARKNTTNGWEDFRRMVIQRMSTAPQRYRATVDRLNGWKALACDELRGIELLGLAQYEGILKPQQVTIAMKEWREPTHAEFQERNVYSLNAAGTEALKRGAPGGVVGRYAAWDAWLGNALDRQGAPVRRMVIDAEDPALVEHAGGVLLNK